MTRTVLAPVQAAAVLPVRVQQGVVAGLPPTVFGSPGRTTLPQVILQPGPPLSRTKFQDRDQNDVQEKTFRAIQQSKANPKANVRLLENVALAQGPNFINHGLGIPFRGVALSGFAFATTWSIERPGSNPQQDQTTVIITITNAQGTVCDIEIWG